MSFDRRYTLLVDGAPFVAGGPGRQMRIDFTISIDWFGAQATGDIAIYNLATSSVDQKIKPASTVALSAGYDGNEGGIFAGKVMHVLHERTGPDTITRILALSNERVDTAINSVFAVDTKVADVIYACSVAIGYPLVWTPEDFDNEPLYTGGLSLPSVSAIGVLRELADRHAFYAAVENGKLVVTKHGSSRAGEKVIISEINGMVGIPEVTWIGVDVATTMNPSLVIGGVFEVDAKLQTFNMANFYYKELPSGTGRGVYAIRKLVHEGDNWGDTWQTKVTGQAING